MAWNYRKSLRFPGGIRINLSKSGVGYSWGFRGFRVGKSSKGRVMRTISLPGTGIYSRTTLRGAGSNRAQPSTAKSNSLALVLLLFVLVFLSFAYPLLWVLVGVLVLLLIKTANGKTGGVPSPDLGAPSTDFDLDILPRSVNPEPQAIEVHQSSNDSTVSDSNLEQLIEAHNAQNVAERVRSWVGEVTPFLKQEMRSIRMATAASSIIEADITSVILHYGINGNVVSDPAAELYLEIFRGLNPRSYAHLTVATVKAIMLGVNESGVHDYRAALKRPTTYNYLQKSSISGANQLAAETIGLFISIAKAAGGSTSDITGFAHSFVA